MKNEQLYKAAYNAIQDLFSDTSVPGSSTRENLETLKGEIDILLDVLGALAMGDKRPMTTLVIPDVHEKIDIVKRILEQEEHQHVVFLGDWFDRFPSQPGDTTATLQWLWDHISDDNKTFLYGNHDLPYAFPEIYGLRCSGYQIYNQDIHRFFQSKDAQYSFRLLHQIDDILLSHAGVAKQTLDMRLAAIWDLETQAMYRLSRGDMHFMVAAGVARGGYEEWGGCAWLDWDKEFEPTPGVRQIVGHTKHKEPQWKGDNLCLDTNLQHYAIIEDGNVTVKEAAKLGC